MQHSIIKKQLVRLGQPGEPGQSPARTAGARPGRQRKAVQLLRVAQQVVALELTCSCGEVSVVEFEYPTDSESGAAS